MDFVLVVAVTLSCVLLQQNLLSLYWLSCRFPSRGTPFPAPLPQSKADKPLWVAANDAGTVSCDAMGLHRANAAFLCDVAAVTASLVDGKRKRDSLRRIKAVASRSNPAMSELLACGLAAVTDNVLFAACEGVWSLQQSTIGAQRVTSNTVVAVHVQSASPAYASDGVIVRGAEAASKAALKRLMAAQLEIATGGGAGAPLDVLAVQMAGAAVTARAESPDGDNDDDGQGQGGGGGVAGHGRRREAGANNANDDGWDVDSDGGVTEPLVQPKAADSTGKKKKKKKGAKKAGSALQPVADGSSSSPDGGHRASPSSSPLAALPKQEEGLLIGKHYYQALLPVFSRTGRSPLVLSVVIPKHFPSPSSDTTMYACSPCLVYRGAVRVVWPAAGL